MSKVLQATCIAGVVKVGLIPVPDTTVLSQGVASSSGVLIIDEDKKTYIPNSSADLKSALDQLSTALDKISASLSQSVTIFTEIGAGMTGPTTAPPPTLAVDTTVITTNVTAITAAKTAIDLLKGALK